MKHQFGFSDESNRLNRLSNMGRGLDSKLHLAVDSHGMPLRAIIAQGTTADCTEAIALIDGFTAENFLGDNGYDTDAILE